MQHRSSIRFFLVVIVALAGFGLCGGQEEVFLSFYEVRPVDGNDIWREAFIEKFLYRYRRVRPEPGELSTEYGLVYDTGGIHVRVCNKEDDPGKINCRSIMRDDPDLWRDDCNEFYFDSDGRGIGYRRFAVNASGVVGDSQRVDAATELPYWSGIDWVAPVRMDSDGWMVEAYFPWSDLGRTASPGSIWRFCLTRYSYTSGSFRGISSSCGGSYETPSSFGLIYFSTGQPISYEGISRSISSMVSKPWSVFVGEKMISCSEGGVISVADPCDVARERLVRLRKGVESMTEKAGDDDIGEIQSAIKAIGEVPSMRNSILLERWLIDLGRIARRVDDIKCSIAITDVINQATSQGVK